jgi:ankyrin repeat protein
MVSTDEGGAEVKEDFGITSRALRLIKEALGEEQPEEREDKCSESGDGRGQTGHLASLVDELVGALLWACRKGYHDVAELLLDRGADVGQADEDGWTALMRACQNGHRDVAELLLDRGADVGQADEDGWTALMLACQKGHHAVAELLLDQGADVGQAKQNGWTALMWARNSGHDDVVELLLSRGAGGAEDIAS